MTAMDYRSRSRARSRSRIWANNSLAVSISAAMRSSFQYHNQKARNSKNRPTSTRKTTANPTAAASRVGSQYDA